MENNKLKRMRKIYKRGTRVELEHMDDVQAPPKGTRGTVFGVDDAENILVRWDNGSSLSLIDGVDKFWIVFGPTTVCYGDVRNWNTMDEALSYFLEGMVCSDGSERDRYATIYSKLKSGMMFATDD